MHLVVTPHDYIHDTVHDTMLLLVLAEVKALANDVHVFPTAPCWIFKYSKAYYVGHKRSKCRIYIRVLAICWGTSEKNCSSTTPQQYKT